MDLLPPIFAVKRVFCSSYTNNIEVYVTDKDGYEYVFDDNLLYCLIRVYGYIGEKNKFHDLFPGDYSFFYFESRDANDIDFFLKYVIDAKTNKEYKVEFNDELTNGELPGIEMLEYLCKNMSKIERRPY